MDDVRPSFFLGRVRDAITRAPVVSSPSTTVLEIAQLLSAHGVGSVVVLGPDSTPVGIVTDRDLRRKVVAEGRDAATTRASDIMSAPVISISADAFAFEAILEMTRRGIRHLAVTDGGGLTGVVSIYDFVLSESLHPVLLAREIERARSVEALAPLSARITGLTRRLLAEGGMAHDVGQVISELNDRVVERVLALSEATVAESGLTDPGVRFCWLSFGSEARREQTLRTDQDNGLVFEDPPADRLTQAETYYSRLGALAVDGLVRVGVPPCPGGIMASNPRWCRPLSVWCDYFRGWITEPTPDQVLGASIHFDLRPLGPAHELGQMLQEIVRHEPARHPGFLRVLARDVVDRRVPLTLLGRIAVRRSDPHRGALDLKGAGALQLVGAARVHALELGLTATNTIDRFRGAAAQELYTDAEAREISDAVQHLMRLRLLHQLDQFSRGESADNFVVPTRLSHADRILLREALRTVVWVQGMIRERFATDFVSG